MGRAVGCLLLYWCILLVYSLSVYVCSQPLIHSEWLRTGPKEYFGWAFRGQKIWNDRLKVWHLVGIKFKRHGNHAGETCWKMVHYILSSAGKSRRVDVFDAYAHHAYPIDAFVFIIPHSLLIPYCKSMPAAPTAAPTACLTSWRGKEESPLQHYRQALYC